MDIIPHHRSRGLKIALMSAVVFGIWPASMRGMYAEGGNAVFALLITTWVRALALAGFCVMTRRLLFQTRTDTRNAITGGFAQAVAMLALCAALTLLPGPLVIIILFSHTLMLLFYMAWRGEVRLDRFTVLTTIVALAGLALALDVIHAQSASNITGYSLAFLAAIATVARLYVYGHQTQARHPIIVGAENFLAAAAFTLPALFFSVPHAPASFVGYAYLLLGCMALTSGTFGMFYGISLMGSFRWSLFAKLEPLSTAFFSALLLGETLKPVQYAGVAIVVSSLAFYQIMDRAHNKTARQQSRRAV